MFFPSTAVEPSTGGPTRIVNQPQFVVYMVHEFGLICPYHRFAWIYSIQYPSNDNWAWSPELRSVRFSGECLELEHGIS